MSNIMTEEELLQQEMESRTKEKPKKQRPPAEKKKKSVKCKSCGFDQVLNGPLVQCVSCGQDPYKKPEKPKKSEAELVQQYAEQTIRKYQTRGHAGDKIGKKEGTQVNKDLWMDSDFFFSIVFESSAQKYAFMAQAEAMIRELTSHKEFELDEPFGSTVQIVNGVKLAEVLGIPLERETSRNYPYGALDLKPYVLDEEAF